MAAGPRPASAWHGPPPQLLIVAGAASGYAGAAVAVLLFHTIAPLGLSWLRSLFAAVFLCAWRRPWQVHWTRANLVSAAVFGVVISLLNATFYLAIAHLALGTTVAIEFVGPVAVAAVGSRRRRDFGGLVLLVAGVGLLSGIHLAGSPVGVAWALAAGVMWAVYVVLGHRVSRIAELRPQDGLAAGFAIGSLVLAPALAWHTTAAFTRADIFGRVVLVAVASSVVPYAFEQLAMRMLTRQRFAVMLALLPATATLIGLAALGQVPSLADLGGITLVVGAIVATA